MKRARDHSLIYPIRECFLKSTFCLFSFLLSSSTQLSGGLLEQSGAALERCYDDSLWDVAPGGDWILHRCLSRLGFPLSPMDGMHQLDSSAAAETRDVLERHPVRMHQCSEG